MKKIPVVVVCFLLCSYSVQAQKQEIQVKKIDVELKAAPGYRLQTGEMNHDASLKWLVVEAELESKPEWADEVNVQFYVVANYGSNAKGAVPPDRYDILSTSVTIVNMEKNTGTGKKNLVPVFMDARTVKKYDAAGIQQFIPEVAVSVMYKGALQHIKWMKNESSGRFWERKQPRAGILLNLMQSPWWPVNADYYELVKPAGSPQAF